jgi:hypothetical protein
MRLLCQRYYIRSRRENYGSLFCILLIYSQLESPYNEQILLDMGGPSKGWIRKGEEGSSIKAAM